MSALTASAISDLLARLELAPDNPGAFDGDWIETTGARIESLNPATGEPLAAVRSCSPEEYERVAAASVRAFEEWRTWPAPGDSVSPRFRPTRCPWMPSTRCSRRCTACGIRRTSRRHD